VAATTSDGERLYGALEFLGPLQRVIEEAGLPWHHFDFDLELDPSGESMVVSRDRRATPDGVRPDLDLERRLKLLALRVGEHAGSVREVLGRAARDGMPMLLRVSEHGALELGRAAEDGMPIDVVTLVVSFDVAWELPDEDIQTFIDWFNERMGIDEDNGDSEYTITVERLRQGTLVDNWRYAPPSPLDLLFDDLWRDRAASHLGLEALAWAVLSDDRFRLAQPDDVYTMVAWRAQDVGLTDPD
jgi:hypothetical protein